MKKTIGILLLALLIVTCKKDKYGKMKYIAKFSAFSSKSPKKPAGGDTTHTIFGDYIMSITPTRFACNARMFIFQDHYDQSDPTCHMIAFIENTNMNLDFSENAEIEFKPTLHSTDIMYDIFEQKEVDFRFISFSSYLYTQEFELPKNYLEQVKNKKLWGLQGSTFDYQSDTNKIKVSSANTMLYYKALHGNSQNKPTGFEIVFGSTDSSYIYMYNGTDLPEEKRFPFWNQSDMVIIRSNNFKTQKIVMPGKDQTYTMYSTLSFNLDNLIQVYTGRDKLPYTEDDEFVYAPNFWNRLNVNLEMKYD